MKPDGPFIYYMDVKLPKLGESAEGGAVVSILVKEGDTVTKGQTILELENEKAVAPIPSTSAGVVTQIRVKEGDRVSVGQVLITVAEAGGAAPAPAAAAPKAAKPAAKAAPVVRAPVEAEPEVEEAADEEAPADDVVESGLPPAASPEIRRIARELGIDLRRIRGSENGGRIVMSDVRAYVQHLIKAAAAPTFTIAPRDASRCGSAALVAFSAVFTLISYMRSQVAPSASANGFHTKPPAMFKSASMRPAASLIFVIAVCAASNLVMSTPPSASGSFANSAGVGA